MSDGVMAARRSAAIFRLGDRALLEVRGSDRLRFLQGQLSNDVAVLDPATPRASCYALVLTREGRIVADFHVVARADAFWLETDRAVAAAAVERLSKYVVADDVVIADRSDAFARFAVEGPCAQSLVAAALGAPVALAADEVVELPMGGALVIVADWSSVGGTALQLFAAPNAAEDLLSALRAAGRAFDAVVGSDADLEVLRIEAGVPRAGAEIGPETLPAELHLVDRAVSFTKGCFTGQEVVTRMHTRGRVGHQLVGIELGAAAPLPSAGAPVARGGVRVGAITSALRSPTAGPIALAILRKGSEEPGTIVEIENRSARVVDLPFVPIPGRA